MGIGQPPHKEQDRIGVDNVASLRLPGDEFFDVLSPLLEEAATVKDDESPGRGTPQRSVALEGERSASRACGWAIEPSRRPPCPRVGGCRSISQQQA